MTKVPNWDPDDVERTLNIRPGYRPSPVGEVLAPPFLASLDPDLQELAMTELRVVWSHHSTAIEGNRLTLAETRTWLETGEYLGHRTEEYTEVGGQAEALDMLWTLLDRDLETRDLLEMHEFLIPFGMRRPNDIVGRWKVRPNGIWRRDASGRATLHMLIEPEFVPRLMEEFVEEVNKASFVGVQPGCEHIEFARLQLGFVNVHPFFDGNGRMSRMIANIPLLRSGLDPLIIPVERRAAYMAALGEYSDRAGELRGRNGIWPDGFDWPEFREFCLTCMPFCSELLGRFRKRQAERIQRS